MTSLTYGVLPEFGEFEKAFDVVVTTGRYRICLSSCDSRAMDKYSLGDGSYTCEELYKCVQAITQDKDATDEALDVVSSILTTLGFEWV